MIDKKSKILILGLDNSGKSTILLSLKEETNLLSYLSLKPTRGVSIEQLQDPNHDIFVWDFGGQREYRSDYITNFAKYLKEVDEILYVIDIQDYERYDEALIYLEKIIQSIEKEKINVEMSVFLHKYDPNLKNKREFEKIDENVSSLINNHLIDIIPNRLKYKIYRTSVYTLLEKNLIYSK